MVMDRISVVVPLPNEPSRALSVLEALATLGEEPAHDVVLVDDSDGALNDLLAFVEGDVTVVRSPGAIDDGDALRLALDRVRPGVVAMLARGIAPARGWLGPLVAALDLPAVAATTSAGPDTGHAVPALAARTADLGSARGDDLAAVALCLAAGGAVRPVPASVTTLAAGPSGPRARSVPGQALELSIVIPTLDASSDRARRALRAIERATDAPHEIVLVHNGAPPQGFSPPVNAGLRATRAPYVVVMNDDVEPLPGWWPPLRAALDAGAAVAFPRTVEGFDRPDFAAWCFAMPRQTLEAHAARPGEFFDPELVVHFQDTDLMLRLHEAGTPPVRVEASGVQHGLSESLESDDPELRAWVAGQIACDREVFARKHPESFASMVYVSTR
jgi:hypothetical protein